MTRLEEALKLLTVVEDECGFAIDLSDAREQIYAEIGRRYLAALEEKPRKKLPKQRARGTKNGVRLAPLN